MKLSDPISTSCCKTTVDGDDFFMYALTLALADYGTFVYISTAPGQHPCAVFIDDDVDDKVGWNLFVPSAPFYELITDSRQEAQLIK